MTGEEIFIQRRAAQLAAEAERMREAGKEITGPMILRAADIVSVKDAADVAEVHGRPVLAWLLRRLVTRLRALPVADEEPDK